MSASFYGTFDQGGNVWEWNESFFDNRGVEGGGWNSSSGNHLTVWIQGAVNAPSETNNIGFRVAARVATLPEPSAGLLVALGMLGLMQRRRS